MQERSGHLVIVDDDPDVLNALRFAFEVDGYAVETHTAAEAVLAAPARGAACYIIDENLPGVSGVEAAATLRSRGIAAPIILITTYPSPALRLRAAQCGADIVEKPLISDALGQLVKQVAGAGADAVKR